MRKRENERKIEGKRETREKGKHQKKEEEKLTDKGRKGRE